jgi:hypothetical protein
MVQRSAHPRKKEPEQIKATVENKVRWNKW